MSAAKSARRALEAHGELRLVDRENAKHAWATFRSVNGRKSYQPLLTPPSANAKFHKDGEVLTYGVSLAPSASSGEWQVCQYKTPTCERCCVAFAGKGELASVLAGRVLKTRFLMEDPDAFISLVYWEVRDAVRKHGADGMAIRLNAFSDLPWERYAPWLFAMLPEVRFYDYTKDWSRVTLPANYHLTYSVSERTSDEQISGAPGSVAVVFSTRRGRELPASYMGRRVVDGDKSDNRTSDPQGVVVGLRAKGRMVGDTSGMVKKGDG